MEVYLKEQSICLSKQAHLIEDEPGVKDQKHFTPLPCHPAHIQSDQQELHQEP